jgi:pyruvate dehydrogenase E1 component alpha subunit
MAGKELPKIRAGMGDVEAPVVETWSDDDYARATGLTTILSPDGSADRAGVPALEPDALRACYQTMLRMRALGDRMRARAEARDEDPVPSDRGCEAAIVGAVAALEADDVVVPGRRESSAALWRGHPVAAFAAGAAVPRALGVLPVSPHAATQLPHATGIAWAMKLQAKAPANQPAGKPSAAGAGKVTLAYLDREATSAEDFHAGLNFAGVFRVPAVFVCINGGSGATAPSVETVSQTLAVKALAYGIAGVRVDGNDLFAVFAATRAAAARARRGDGATLIEAVLATNGDPLERVGRWLAAQKILDATAEVALRREVDAEVDLAFAEQ